MTVCNVDHEGRGEDRGFDLLAVDWAGTLTGTRHRPTGRLVRQVLKRHFRVAVPDAFAARYDEVFWTYYHRSLPDSLARLLTAAAEETGTRLPEMHRLTAAIWDTCPDHDIDPAAADALRGLRRRYQVPVWLATNTCRPGSLRRRSLVRADLGFVQTLCSSTIGVAKPDPGYYQELVRRSGVPAERILFIGDHLIPDVLGPAEAGMPTVWINGATHHEAAEDTIPATTITVPHLSHLPAVLAGAGR